MQYFQIILRNEKTKLYQLLGWSIILILLLLFSWIGFFTNLPFPKIRTIPFIAAMLIAFFIWLYFRKTKYHFGLSPFFYILSLGWLLREQYVFFGITLFFELFYTISSRRKSVTVSKSFISYPSFPFKKIEWIKLNNCLIKDGLLTIDFKNNKIIQQVIDDEKTKVNEKEFNEFCRQQLSVAAST